MASSVDGYRECLLLWVDETGLDYNVVSTGAKTGNNITINRWVSARGSYKCHCDLTELHRFRSTSHVVVLMMSHYLVQFTR